eukprot:SAG31_NODE_206_length_20335_cov_17.910160_23_plen_108_part_00
MSSTAAAAGGGGGGRRGSDARVSAHGAPPPAPRRANPAALSQRNVMLAAAAAAAGVRVPARHDRLDRGVELRNVRARRGRSQCSRRFAGLCLSLPNPPPRARRGVRD